MSICPVVSAIDGMMEKLLLEIKYCQARMDVGESVWSASEPKIIDNIIYIKHDRQVGGIIDRGNYRDLTTLLGWGIIGNF